MKDKLTNKEVLRLVDGICLGYNDGKQNLKEAEDHIGMIYRAVHSHNNSICYDSHDNWRKEAVKNLKTYKEWGMC